MVFFAVYFHLHGFTYASRRKNSELNNCNHSPNLKCNKVKHMNLSSRGCTTPLSHPPPPPPPPPPFCKNYVETAAIPMNPTHILSFTGQTHFYPLNEPINFFSEVHEHNDVPATGLMSPEPSGNCFPNRNISGEYP
jgi:hypothetical protein